MAKIGREINTVSPQTAEQTAKLQDLDDRLTDLESAVMSYDDEIRRKNADLIRLEAMRAAEESTRLNAEAAVREAEFNVHEAEMKRVHAEQQLARRTTELRNVDKALKSATAENDIIFDHFNKELEKMAAGFKAGRGEVELVRLLREVQAKQSEINKENQWVESAPGNGEYVLTMV